MDGVKALVFDVFGTVVDWRSSVTKHARAREAGWGMYQLDSGHDPMVSHPRELAEILLGIAASF